MTSSIFKIMRTTWVASISCSRLLLSDSNTFCSLMSVTPSLQQSTPWRGQPSLIWRALMAATVSMAGRPEFSARAAGMVSSASANARMAYCSMVGTLLAASCTARLQAISTEPPPYTTRLSTMRLRVTHSASCTQRLASSTTILLLPRRKMVVAFWLLQPSTTIMRSFVVPNDTSRTMRASPSLSALTSLKRGTMRAPVAMASSSISTPPTQRMAGRSFCSSRWFASSSNPHWHTARLHPVSLIFFTMSTK
mmetsp:Transcript_33466/g.84011  ORF Transcript_33466/g.84011 Transcript_33466/m.84011 type:complete len:251 (+) Transcript_33466:104-856(+)